MPLKFFIESPYDHSNLRTRTAALGDRPRQSLLEVTTSPNPRNAAEPCFRHSYLCFSRWPLEGTHRQVDDNDRSDRQQSERPYVRNVSLEVQDQLPQHHDGDEDGRNRGASADKHFMSNPEQHTVYQ